MTEPEAIDIVRNDPWHVSRNGKQYHAASLDVLKKWVVGKNVHASDFIYHSTLGEWKRADAVLTDILVTVACGVCGATGQVPAFAPSFACPACAQIEHFYSCPSCAAPVTLKSNLIGNPVQCLSCGRSNFWTMWHKHQSSANMAAVAGEADADRRVVHGVVIAANGLPPLGRGHVCGVEFKGDSALVVVAESGVVREVATLSFQEIRGLQVTGRGELSQTTGGGFIGGGFGIGGFIKGALMAEALNAMTTRTSEWTETLLQIDAGSRQLIMHTGQATPEQLRASLAPIFVRIQELQNAEHLGATHDKKLLPTTEIEDLAKLGALYSKGLLTADEFASAKAALLVKISAP